MDLCNFHISSHGHMTLGPTKPLIHHSSMLIHKTEPIKTFSEIRGFYVHCIYFSIPNMSFCAFKLHSFTGLNIHVYLIQ